MAEAWLSEAFVWATGGEAEGVDPSCTVVVGNATLPTPIPFAYPGKACYYDMYPNNPGPACGHHDHCNTERPDCGCCGDAGGADVGQCALLSGGFSLFVQLMCAVMGFGSLVLKKKFLDDKKGVDRGWAVWGMDVAKQGTSGVAAHLAGIFNSWLLNNDEEGGNQCSWYFISFTFDTTLGVVIGYCLLQMLQKVATSGAVAGMICPSLQSSGNYKKEGTDEVDYLIWAKQMVSWCAITVIARACVGCLLLLNKFWLQSVSQWVAQLFPCQPNVFLVLVMVGCPFGLNALQLVRAHPPLSHSTISCRH